MFVSYKWLEDYVDLKGMDPAVLAEKITRAGIEVEGIEYKGEGIKGVVIGHVLEREQHPNADKLNKCLVDIGAEAPVQIICARRMWIRDKKSQLQQSERCCRAISKSKKPSFAVKNQTA